MMQGQCQQQLELFDSTPLVGLASYSFAVDCLDAQYHFHLTSVHLCILSFHSVLPLKCKMYDCDIHLHIYVIRENKATRVRYKES